ncbi:MAG: flippase-like domain-containing protein [Fimbriimonadaceae bacterium]|nr:flippase-like domain-containing protein [Fimbriimonadaceae bacterium]
MTEAVDKPGQPLPAPARRGWLGWLARAAVSAVVLGWVFTRPENRAAVAGVSGHTAVVVLWAVLLYAGCQLLTALRWWWLLRLVGAPVPYLATVRVTFSGMFANYCLPTSVGGDLVRIGLVTRHGVPATLGALTVFLQRFTGLVVLLLFGLLGLAAGAGQTDPSAARLLSVVGALSAGGLLCLAALALAEQRRQISQRLPRALGGPLRKLSAALQQLASQPRGLLLVLALSVTYQLLIVGLQAWLGWTAGVRPAAVHWFWTVPMVTLTEMVPLPGGLGIREAAAEGVFHVLGFGALGALASLLWQATKFLTSLPGGLLLAWGERREPRP